MRSPRLNTPALVALGLIVASWMLLASLSSAFALGGFGPNGGGSGGGGTVPGAVCGDSSHALAWNGTAYFCQAITGSAAAGGTSGQVQWNNGGGLSGFDVSGDATLVTSTGVLTLATVNANTGSWGDSTHVAQVTLNGKGLATAASSVAIAFPVTTVFGRSGAVVAAANDYNFNQLAGSAAASQMPAFTGDATSSAGATALTLATVNANTGAWGSSTNCPTITLNGKGLATAASQAACAPPFSAVTGSIALSQFPTLAADSFWLNATGSAAVPTAVAFPSCSTGSSALTYNTTSHAVGCNTISGGSLAYTATFSGNVSGAPSGGLGLVLSTATFTDNTTAGAGTAALFLSHAIFAPTLNATNTVTATHAPTLYIDNAPTCSGTETCTTKGALYIANGDVNMGTAGQKFQMFNVGTPGAANTEGYNCSWVANVYTCIVTKAGTGTARSIAITSLGTMTLDAPTNLVFTTTGVTKLTFNSSTLFGPVSGARVVYGTVSTGTVPTLIPFGAATTTGLGGATGVPAMIVGAATIESWSSTGPTVAVIPADTAHTDASICRDTTTGALYTGTGTLGVCLGTSSARYKSNIVDLTPGLPELLQLQPRQFFYKDASVGDPTKQMYGFIAEEAQPILPYLVGYDDQGQPNTFDYMGLVPILVKAVQQQQNQIDNLQKRLLLLEKKVGP